MISKRFLIIILSVLCAVIVYMTVCSHVECYYSSSDPILVDLCSKLSQLDDRLKNVKVYAANKSYTINKKNVYICLKDRNGKYYDRNMLTYVICHEYAHILCDEIDHTEKFVAIFENLLKRAEMRGLYNPNIPPVENYCM